MYASHLRDVVMAIFGLSHTRNTMVRLEFNLCFTLYILTINAGW